MAFFVGDAELAVSLGITCRHKCVMDAWAGVVDELQDREAVIRGQDVVDLWPQMERAGAGVGEGQEGGELVVGESERPEVDDLCTVGIDYADCVAF